MFCFSLFHSVSTASFKKFPHPSISPLNARVFDGNPFMDLMDFFGLFLQDLGDEKKKKKKQKACLLGLRFQEFDGLQRTAISVSVKRMRNFQLTKQDEWVNTDLRAGWLQSHVKKDRAQRRGTSPDLLRSQTWRQIRKWKKRDKNNKLNFGDSSFWSLHFQLTRKTEIIHPPKKVEVAHCLQSSRINFQPHGFEFTPDSLKSVKSFSSFFCFKEEKRGRGNKIWGWTVLTSCYNTDKEEPITNALFWSPHILLPSVTLLQSATWSQNGCLDASEVPAFRWECCAAGEWRCLTKNAPFDGTSWRIKLWSTPPWVSFLLDQHEIMSHFPSSGSSFCSSMGSKYEAERGREQTECQKF